MPMLLSKLSIQSVSVFVTPYSVVWLPVKTIIAVLIMSAK